MYYGTNLKGGSMALNSSTPALLNVEFHRTIHQWHFPDGESRLEYFEDPRQVSQEVFDLSDATEVKIITIQIHTYQDGSSEEVPGPWVYTLQKSQIVPH